MIGNMKLVIAFSSTIIFFNYILTDKVQQRYTEVFFERCNGVCNEKFCSITYVCRPYNRTSKIRTVDIKFHDGVILEAPVNIEIIAYKKFRTQYRPFMMTLRGEVCHELLVKNHPYFQLMNGYTSVDGSLYDPCPFQGRRYTKSHPTERYMDILVPTGEWKLEWNLTKIINGSVTKILSAAEYYTIKATSAVEF